MANIAAETGATSPTEPARPVTPTQQIPSSADLPEIDVEPVTFHDVAGVAGSYARGWVRRASDFLAMHTLLAGVIAALLVAVVLGVVLLARSVADLPDRSLVTKDARARVAAPSYDGGDFGYVDALVLTSTEIDELHKDVSSPNACEAQVTMRYINGYVSAVQDATLRYEHTSDGWRCVEALVTGSPSFTAERGVDRRRIANSLNVVLLRAESSLPDSEGTLSLATIYQGADVTVTNERFDEDTQTDTVTLRVTKASTFTAYECTIDASFAFRPGNGLWELTSATASPGAKQVTLTPLVGTWTGTFESQETAEGKCFGAKEGGLRVTIDSVQGGRVTGTLSGLAHYHPSLSADADSAEGDTRLSDVHFTGTFVEDTSSIVFLCKTPEDASGSVQLTLVFGLLDDPTAATATLTTTHQYWTTFLLIPFEHEVTYSDTFALTRAGGGH